MPRDRVPSRPAAAAACTRREAVLALGQTLGLTAAASLLGPGCLDGDGGSTAPGAADLHAGTRMCGDKLCVDINHPANMALFGQNGSRVVAAGSELLMVIRRSAIEVLVLSARCTYMRCTLQFDREREVVTCPCHGCEYALSGTAMHPPAIFPLATHEAMFDGVTVTITL